MPTSSTKSAPSAKKSNAKGNDARRALPAPKAPPRAIKPAPAPSPPIAAMVARRSVPAASRAKAKAAFANFTLSKHGNGAKPENHVAAGQSVVAVQRAAMARQVEQLPLNGAVSVAFPPDRLKALLPSYDPAAGRVNLDDVMNVLEQNMHGHEFFASGNPTLNRMAVQSQVKDIIAAALKGGAQ